MAYYQGDYYQGDYYQGDPFLGALIAKGASWLGKKIFKRKLSQVGTAELAKRSTGVMRRATRWGGSAVAGGAIGSGVSIPIPFSPFQVTPQAFLPGGKPLFSRRPEDIMGPPDLRGQAGCCPSGFHLAKDGSGRCVRNRSMNVANPRALRRSLRRVAGFGKLAQRSKTDIKRAARALGA